MKAPPNRCPREWEGSLIVEALSSQGHARSSEVRWTTLCICVVLRYPQRLIRMCQLRSARLMGCEIVSRRCCSWRRTAHLPSSGADIYTSSLSMLAEVHKSRAIRAYHVEAVLRRGANAVDPFHEAMLTKRQQHRVATSLTRIANTLSLRVAVSAYTNCETGFTRVVAGPSRPR